MAAENWPKQLFSKHRSMRSRKARGIWADACPVLEGKGEVRAIEALNLSPSKRRPTITV